MDAESGLDQGQQRTGQERSPRDVKNSDPLAKATLPHWMAQLSLKESIGQNQGDRAFWW